MGALAMQMETDEQQATDGLTVDEMIDFAKKVVLDYFEGRPYYCGGKIPPHILTARKRMDKVLDCTFDEAMDIAYEALEKELTVEDQEYIDAGGVSPDIKSLINVLHDMARHGVPQELSNGMLVIYIELCMGGDVVYV